MSGRRWLISDVMMADFFCAAKKTEVLKNFCFFYPGMLGNA